MDEWLEVTLDGQRFDPRRRKKILQKKRDRTGLKKRTLGRTLTFSSYVLYLVFFSLSSGSLPTVMSTERLSRRTAHSVVDVIKIFLRKSRFPQN